MFKAYCNLNFSQWTNRLTLPSFVAGHHEPELKWVTRITFYPCTEYWFHNGTLEVFNCDFDVDSFIRMEEYFLTRIRSV